jgi:hypothetical protein
MEAIPLAALSIGGSSRAPIPATRDRFYLGQSAGDCRDRWSKRRRKNDVFSFPPAESGFALYQRRRHRQRIENYQLFSDPIRDKLTFLKNASAAGYNVVLCFIGISGPEISEERVGMRVSQGGHDVPSEKLVSQFPRTLANLDAAIQTLPIVLVFDNEDLAAPFRKVAEFQNGKSVFAAALVPQWLRAIR